MITVKTIRELRMNIAHVQRLLRETHDERAIAEADLLDERSQALGALLDELTGPQWSHSVEQEGCL